MKARIISLLLTTSLCAKLSDYELELISQIPDYTRLSDTTRSAFETIPAYDYNHVITQHGIDSNVLVKYYPHLQKTLSYIQLSDLPTPIHYCKNLSALFVPVQLFVKNDGVIGQLQTNGKRLFGANKVRKLEYLCADALAHGHTSIVTFGCAGSNHVVQTALHAQRLGLACDCMLKPQPNARIVQRNLLLDSTTGAELHYSQNNTERARDTVELCKQQKEHTAMLPYIIPTGGSSPRGAIGYVQAAYELKEQIDAGIMPIPDHIYVTLGSMGTAAGLLLGFKALGTTPYMHLVLDEPGDKTVALQNLQNLFNATNDLLIALDPSFPRCELDTNNFTIYDEYSGEDYGLFTSAGVEAIKILKEHEGLHLDGVYTGKSFSALLHDLQNNTLNHSTVLFWNTSCTEDMTDIVKDIDYHVLPKPFHVYFEEKVQPLDCW